LQRGRETYPKAGHGLPPVVTTAGEALTYFELAVERSPGCAEAYVALGRAYLGFPSWPGLPPKERFGKVKAAAKKAIALQENLAAAHLVLGQAEFNTAQWAPAEKELLRALALAPKDPSAHVAYAEYLAAIGYQNKAIAEIEQARKVAPDASKLNLAAALIYLLGASL
jgi:tetratricopeptide (TPR) repeat protein